MKPNSIKPIRPLLLIFVLVSAIIFFAKDQLLKWSVDRDVLMMGNLIVFITILLSYFLLNKALNSTNPQAFVRAMYGSFIVKFFILAITAFVYIMVVKKDVNKPALFACIGLYFIYTFIEVGALLRMMKRKQNA